jgi:hypothetical protein
LRDELSDLVIAAAWDFNENELNSNSDDFSDNIDTDKEDLNDETNPNKGEKGNKENRESHTAYKYSFQNHSTMFTKGLSISIGS